MSQQPYPLPRFHFQVDWAGSMMSFTEVTGLVMEREKIEYRHSDSADFHKLQQPGLQKVANIVFKRGTFEKNTEFANWYLDVADDRQFKRRDIIIRLLNEKHQPVAAWKAARCFPLKVSAPDLKADANEIAIESMEVAHEGLSPIAI
jgi:phage tail-like protein